MATKIQFRRDSAENWSDANPTLYEGELGFETDTGSIKIGDGATAWNSLNYWSGGDQGYAVLADLAPVAISGIYADLSDTPTIPADISDLTDNNNLLASGGVTYATETYVDDSIINLVTNVLDNDPNFAQSVYEYIDTKANIESLATVATSGSYDDLSDLPTIPEAVNLNPGAEGLIVNGFTFYDAGAQTITASYVNHYYLSNIHIAKNQLPADFNTTVDSSWTVNGFGIVSVQEWITETDKWEITLDTNWVNSTPVVFSKEISEAYMAFPDSTVQTTAYVAPSFTHFEIDGSTVNTTGLTGADTIYITPAIGYGGNDNQYLSFTGRDVVGRRTLIINNSSLCTLLVELSTENGPTVNPSTVMEVVYAGNGDWFVISERSF